MQEFINLPLSERQIREAYYSLYDEFGPALSVYSKEELSNKIMNFWKDRGYNFEEVEDEG